MKLITLVIGALMSSMVNAADPITDYAIQGDVIAWHLSKGESREHVCEIASQYFDTSCIVDGDNFVLTRGFGTEITYLSTVTIPSK